MNSLFGMSHGVINSVPGLVVHKMLRTCSVSGVVGNAMNPSEELARLRARKRFTFAEYASLVAAQRAQTLSRNTRAEASFDDIEASERSCKPAVPVNKPATPDPIGKRPRSRVGYDRASSKTATDMGQLVSASTVTELDSSVVRVSVASSANAQPESGVLSNESCRTGFAKASGNVTPAITELDKILQSDKSTDFRSDARGTGIDERSASGGGRRTLSDAPSHRTADRVTDADQLIDLSVAAPAQKESAELNDGGEGQNAVAAKRSVEEANRNSVATRQELSSMASHIRKSIPRRRKLVNIAQNDLDALLARDMDDYTRSQEYHMRLNRVREKYLAQRAARQESRKNKVKANSKSGVARISSAAVNNTTSNDFQGKEAAISQGSNLVNPSSLDSTAEAPVQLPES